MNIKITPLYSDPTMAYSILYILRYIILIYKFHYSTALFIVQNEVSVLIFTLFLDQAELTKRCPLLLRQRVAPTGNIFHHNNTHG